MTASIRTRSELLAEVDDRVVRMKSACGQFDQGNLIEAMAVAVQVRALVHHTDSPLDPRELTWADTAGVTHPKCMSSAACLTLMKIRSGPQGYAEYVPKLDLYPPAPIRTRDGGRIDRGSRIPFDHWWTNPVVRDCDGIDYSRKQLVLALADELVAEGDPETTAARQALADSSSLGWVLASDTGSARTAFERNPVQASVRQIGYEVAESIRQQRAVIEGAAVLG
ncbi:Uncharacterised protein [Mycolicibacterium vanbaalenii]|uniref:Uncharacterized protein n=1 Tax=Mycolicibacterium vanbaalenii TaxID=110539 RepID=A0A5S9R547_MYCVN|nr:hypothetical protein [Mycolicibacterium vanbaalenii]CAA0128345.1 Uncharacterised protein [Mycolicibacterium vanbaalenii]